MGSVPSVATTLRSIARAGEATDSWAARRWLAHRRRLLKSFKIFDSLSFGRIRGAGALGKLGQLRVAWWHIAWLLQKLDDTDS